MEVVRMPLMSDTMTEGTIVEWHKKVGDPVESAELLAEIETDKATMEFEAPEDGFLLHIGVEVGETVPVNTIIAIIGEKGESFEEVLEAENKAKAEEANTTEKAPAPIVQASNGSPSASPAASVSSPAVVLSPPPVISSPDAGGRIIASPLAKRLAAENQISLSQITGTGDGGRIIKRDIEAYLANPQPAAMPAAPAAPAPNKGALPMVSTSVMGQESFEEVATSNMRKTIARRLSESKFGAPHFYLKISINMDNVWDTRKRLNELSPVKISFNDIVIKAAATALRYHPNVNSSWLGDRIRYNKHIHVGMAVAVEEGLLVPVLRFADQKSLSQIAQETNDLGGKAKTKKLGPHEMSGNTFTISNLGMMGIDEFTAIINPPDACIMAVGAIKQVPVVKDGELAVARMMNITLSCDHRVVDGATGALFLQTFKNLLEDPARMLI